MQACGPPVAGMGEMGVVGDGHTTVTSHRHSMPSRMASIACDFHLNKSVIKPWKCNGVDTNQTREAKGLG